MLKPVERRFRDDGDVITSQTQICLPRGLALPVHIDLRPEHEPGFPESADATENLQAVEAHDREEEVEPLPVPLLGDQVSEVRELLSSSLAHAFHRSHYGLVLGDVA